ncbi:putative peroxin 26 [Diplodia seriata]|uniref:Putative peroxin 26 n=1 Tax=Diplodia seriata TaxID=420778 RepID=A0A0G2EKU1_9PEZI|nr:putative peroxin 26 [Diplodia seriata]
MSMTYENMLAASVTSLGSQQRPHTAQIAKTYRQAAQLFLTRRLPEALSTIEPVITPDLPDADGQDHDNKQAAFAPIAYASRGTRVKVWSFYLTFLNSVIELGPEEGKHAFGSTKWKALVSKCRDGRVWEDVVQAGYGGVEGSVDPDVVINLCVPNLVAMP